MSTRRKWPTILVVILILAVAGGLVYRFVFYKPTTNTATSTQKYQSYTVSASDIALSVQGSGAVKAGQTESVTVEYAGSVVSVKAADGDRVKKGDILAVFELPDLEDEIAQLKVDLANADSNLKRLQATTGTTRIYSPVAGLVKTIHAKAGDLVDLVMAKHGSLMVLSVGKKMTVAVKPVSLAGVDAGQSVKVRIGSKTVSGRIREILTDGSVIVIFDDNGYDVGAPATVLSDSGTALGDGKTAISQPFLVTASGGIVDYLSTSVGKSVSVDTTLLRLEEEVLTPAYQQALSNRDALQAELNEKLALKKNQEITAVSDGIVSGLTLKVNDALKENQVVCSIINDATIELTLNVDELDIPAIKVGQSAKVTLDALTDRTYAAKVTKISAIGSYSGGVATYPVTLSIEKPEGILAGMSANAIITVSSSTNVPVIPLAALQTIGNRRFVLNAAALNPDGTLITTTAPAATSGTQTSPGGSNTTPSGGGQMGSLLQKYLIEVTVGLTAENGVEITSGIAIGDKIAIAVSSGSGQPTGLNLGIGGMGGLGGGGTRPSGTGPFNPGTRASGNR